MSFATSFNTDSLAGCSENAAPELFGGLVAPVFKLPSGIEVGRDQCEKVSNRLSTSPQEVVCICHRVAKTL